MYSEEKSSCFEYTDEVFLAKAAKRTKRAKSLKEKQLFGFKREKAEKVRKKNRMVLVY